MEWKKMKTGIRRIISTLLVTAILLTGVLNQTEIAHATVYNWMSKAQTLNLGETYTGLAQPGRNGYDYYGYYYIYLPVNMNITLEIRENGTKHFDWIEVYESNGRRIKFLTNGWKYNRNTNQSVYSEKMRLSRGGYYVNLREGYNAVWGEWLTQSYTVKITGNLTYVTKITSVKKLPKKRLGLTWKRVGNVSGYEVYRSTSAKKNFKKIATVSGNKYTDKRLSKNRRYYYKVRAYKIIGNRKYYTPFSGVKTVKM